MNSLVFLLFFILFQLSSSLAANSVYNVINFGAIADGSSDSTKSFLSAWAAACGSTNPSTIIVPNGNYFLNQANFNGPCKSSITFRITGTLVAPSNYAKLGSSGHWLLFNKVHGLSIYGGTLDGRGTALWACKAAGKNCPFGASVGQSISMHCCKVDHQFALCLFFFFLMTLKNLRSSNLYIKLEQHDPLYLNH